jgi:hypothetical protein
VNVVHGKFHWLAYIAVLFLLGRRNDTLIFILMAIGRIEAVDARKGYGPVCPNLNHPRRSEQQHHTPYLVQSPKLPSIKRNVKPTDFFLNPFSSL